MPEPIKIVLIEDDKFFKDLLVKKLITAGFAVTAASDGETGVKLVETEKPALLLSDILLPGTVDGFEVLRQLRGKPEFKELPVVFLSNLGSKEDIDKGKALNVTSFLIKATVTLDEVIVEVKKALGK
jgi:CheY-like chemotaxis protein